MRYLAVVVIILLSFCASGIARGSSAYQSDDELAAEVQRGFEELLDLWRDGRYADLYDRTTGGTMTRENFARKLAGSATRPACCWEKMQEVKVRVSGSGNASVRVKLGFEVLNGTDFRTKSFKLVKEDGVWRISQSEILALAGATKRKVSYKSRKKAGESQ